MRWQTQLTEGLHTLAALDQDCRVQAYGASSRNNPDLFFRSPYPRLYSLLFPVKDQGPGHPQVETIHFDGSDLAQKLFLHNTRPGLILVTNLTSGAV